MYNPNAQLAQSGEHQPSGFDQWSRWFQNYLVKACKISVTFKATGVDPSGWHMAVLPCISGNPLLNIIGPSASSEQIQGWKENNLIHHKGAMCMNATGGRIGNDDVTRTVTYFAKTANVFGVEDADDLAFQAAINNSPANQWYFGIAIWNRSRASSMPVIGIMSVKITYYAEMWNPTDYSISLIGDETEDAVDEMQDPITPWVFVPEA